MCRQPTLEPFATKAPLAWELQIPGISLEVDSRTARIIEAAGYLNATPLACRWEGAVTAATESALRVVVVILYQPRLACRWETLSTLTRRVTFGRLLSRRFVSCRFVSHPCLACRWENDYSATVMPRILPCKDRACAQYIGPLLARFMPRVGTRPVNFAGLTAVQQGRNQLQTLISKAYATHVRLHRLCPSCIYLGIIYYQYLLPGSHLPRPALA